MGLIRTRITLSNPREPTLAPMEVDALVDTGSIHLCLPEHIRNQLKFNELYQREVTTADGRKHVCPYVGPIQVLFANRGRFTGAFVMGDEVLLGAIPMEDMDLVISPTSRSLTVNPDNPNIAGSMAKGVRRPY